jgi:hypothetical protein
VTKIGPEDEQIGAESIDYRRRREFVSGLGYSTKVADVFVDSLPWRYNSQDRRLLLVKVLN